MKITNMHRTFIHASLVLLLLMFLLVACSDKSNSTAIAAEAANPTTMPVNGVNVIITGGHDTDLRDGGRPVMLIAAALGVAPEVFREAFSHVKPAGAGLEPNPIQVQLNKKALLSALGPYGVTNDHLDTVSNYYRFNGSAGETWPQTQAAATAIVTDGVITGFTITNPGSGYTTPPVITLSNSDATATSELSFTTDFSTNGSLAAIILDP